METKAHFEQFEELKIDCISKEFLTETVKWTSFLSILGFIGIGFFVIISLGMMLMGLKFGPMFGGFAAGLIYLIVAGFYFIPINYLYKFSSNMKLALKNNNQAALRCSFEYLKAHYKFIGILTLIIISFYILMLIWFFISTTGSHF